MIVEFDQHTVEQVVENPSLYAAAYKQHGMIVFKKAYFSDAEVVKIFRALGPELNFTAFATDDNGPREDTLSWPYMQDHDKAIRQDEEDGVNSPEKDLIQWHVEGVAMRWPQYAAGWNMELFACSSEFGKTGLVDMCKMYDDLAEPEKEFLKKSRIIHVPNWQQGDPYKLSRKFIEAIYEAPYDENLSMADLFVQAKRDKVTMIDGDSYINSYSRQAVDPHPASGRDTLRVCPCSAPWGIQDHLVLFDGRQPTKEEIEFFDRLMVKITEEITYNNDIQMWHKWDEGDFALPDLFRMAHGVRGGMQEGQRRFRGNWCFAVGTQADPMERRLVDSSLVKKDKTMRLKTPEVEGVLIIEECFDSSEIYPNLKSAEWQNLRPDSPPESTHLHLVNEAHYSNVLYENIGDSIAQVIKHADEFFGCRHLAYDLGNSLSHMKFVEGSGAGAPEGETYNVEMAGTTTLIFFLNDDYKNGNIVIREKEGTTILDKPCSGDAMLIDGSLVYESLACTDGEKIVAIVHLDRQN
jgi:alpha-ketoglutarate-dependent taurine dioxygenase/predicted 2-oxoglutarate/Fe(II)-dependent dioxygenase YbiX